MFIDWILLPAICVFLSGNIVKLISYYTSLNLTFIIILSIFLYLVFLFLVKCIKVKDVMWFVDAFKCDLVGENLFEFGVVKRF